MVHDCIINLLAYPYAKVTEKQKAAMKDAQVDYLYQ